VTPSDRHLRGEPPAEPRPLTREEYVRKYLSRLVDMVGVDEAAAIHEEVVRRVGEHGPTRAWTAALLKVSLERGHDIGPILRGKDA
jgi:hypothetical protein